MQEVVKVRAMQAEPVFRERLTSVTMGHTGVTSRHQRLLGAPTQSHRETIPGQPQCHCAAAKGGRRGLCFLSPKVDGRRRG